MTDTTEPKPVAYQYLFRDPLSCNPVWRNTHTKWNGQEPYETRRLYDEETVRQLQQSVPMPTTVEQARAMQLIGYAWLRDNAPDQLTDEVQQLQQRKERLVEALHQIANDPVITAATMRYIAQQAIIAEAE